MLLKKYLSKSYILRYLIIIVSIMFVGLGMSITRISCMGTEPFSSLNYSISETFKIPFWIVMSGINAIILIFSLAFSRDLVGLGTIAGMTLLGSVTDFWGKIIKSMVGSDISFTGMESIELRVILLCVGMLIMVFTNSIYISLDLGMAPYDIAGFIIEKLTGKISFRWARVALDSTCVVIAFFVAETNGKQWEIIGIGTVIMAFCVGPLLSFFKENVAKPMLEKIMIE